MNNVIKTKSNIAKQVAFGGINILLTTVSLYLASTLPTNRIFFLALSSVFLSVIVIEFGTKTAFFNYLASSILGFLIIPNKFIMVTYILLLGYYGIVKYYIEKLDNLILEWIIKLVIFNIWLYLVYSFTYSFFFADISIKIPTLVLAVIAQVIFIVYDYAYSVAIWYYRRKLRNVIKK